VTLYYEGDGVELWHGDCLDVLTHLPDASVDAVVTDPPYGLSNTDPGHVVDTLTRWAAGDREYVPAGRGFMGKEWDAFVPPPAVWDECYRILKPGGHLLAFAGSRTFDLMTLSVRFAGFDIRDGIAWLYGSGFPKSLDVSKAIDKAAGATREIVGSKLGQPGYHLNPYDAAGEALGQGINGRTAAERLAASTITAPATPAAQQWAGWGTALKPAWESVVHGVKPQDNRDSIGSRLDFLENACRHTASGAASPSAPIPHGSSEATTASAPAHAATPPVDGPAQPIPTGRAAGSFDRTATSLSGEQVGTCLSIVRSWRRCLAALSAPVSTFITGTASSTTTDLRTLWSCLSRITGPSMLVDPTSPDGLSSLARAVDSLFAAAVLTSNATRALTATEPVTSPTPTDSRAEGGSRFEPIVVARKPLAGTVAANVLRWGTGALNIDATRVGSGEDRTSGGATGKRTDADEGYGGSWSDATEGRERPTGGRWPTNVVLDGDAADALDKQVSRAGGGFGIRGGKESAIYGAGKGYAGTLAETGQTVGYGDSGGASRFFPVFRYEAKAPTVERPTVDGQAHATVKPLDLMRWLVRLVVPRGGLVVDPFAGSGTTAEACLLEGMRCWTAERDAGHLPLIVSRLSKPLQPTLLGVVDEPQPPLEWPPPAPVPPARGGRRPPPPPVEAATLFDVEGLA
jgi:DNA modification methylase